jgi:hypothetical protein
MLKADVPQYLELAESPVNGVCDFVLRRAEYRNQVIDYRTDKGKFQHLKNLLEWAGWKGGGRVKENLNDFNERCKKKLIIFSRHGQIFSQTLGVAFKPATSQPLPFSLRIVSKL